jgi:hypothetical protein
LFFYSNWHKETSDLEDQIKVIEKANYVFHDNKIDMEIKNNEPELTNKDFSGICDKYRLNFISNFHPPVTNQTRHIFHVFYLHANPNI